MTNKTINEKVLICGLELIEKHKAAIELAKQLQRGHEQQLAKCMDLVRANFIGDKDHFNKIKEDVICGDWLAPSPYSMPVFQHGRFVANEKQDRATRMIVEAAQEWNGNREFCNNTKGDSNG